MYWRLSSTLKALSSGGRLQRDLPKQSMKISYLKQKFWIGRSGHLVLLIQLQKRKNFLHLKKRDNKALRGCRHYVSSNVSLSVVLCRELSEITKENKTKTKNKIKQNNNPKKMREAQLTICPILGKRRLKSWINLKKTPEEKGEWPISCLFDVFYSIFQFLWH